MVRTKQNFSRKAAAEKMPGIHSKGPGSSYKARPTHSCQKGIGEFFSKDEPSTSFATSTKTDGDSHDNDSDASILQENVSATISSADETNGKGESDGATGKEMGEATGCDSNGATGKEMGEATGCDSNGATGKEMGEATGCDNGVMGEELNDNPSEDIAESDEDSDNRNFTLHLSTDEDD